MTEPYKGASRVHEFLKTTFETMDQGITIYDRDLRLVAWNDRYSGMGVTPAKHLHYGAKLFDLYVDIAADGVFGAGDPHLLARQHIEAIRNGPLLHTEVLTPPGGRSILIRRFRLPDGGICATFSDVTDEKRAETALRQTQKMDAIGKLTGGVAHDINNVLQIIDGNLEVALKQAELGDEAARSIRSALEASGRGANLIQRLLAFARRQPLLPTLTNVGALLEGMQDMLGKMLGESIEVQVHTDPELGLCNVDRHQLENVVLNLSVNARDAMPEGGTLTLRATHEAVGAGPGLPGGASALEAGSYVCVAATDTGSGMTAATLERAFEPFFTTKAVGRGTGLGLSMAHGFVKQSGGHIEIESTPGDGTSVRIYLPQVRPHGSEEARAPLVSIDPVPPPPSNAATGTVVVVEDDDDLRDLLVRQLRSMGYQARAAANGADALRMLHAIEHPEVLLTDVILPGGMTGPQLAETARDSFPNLSVVLMSGYPEEVTWKEGWKRPSSGWLQKPFRHTDLARALASAVQGAVKGAVKRSVRHAGEDVPTARGGSRRIDPQG